MNRDKRIDFLRGIAMFSVVIGHALAHYDNMSVPYNIIYSFHMPLLFFLSGYLNEKRAVKRNSRGLDKYLLGKIRSLVLPYVSWLSLDIFVIRRIEVSLKGLLQILIGKEGANALWFFPVLFGISVIYGFDCFIRDRYKEKSSSIVLVGMYVLLICIAYITKNVYVVNMLSYFIAFYAGVFAVRYSRIAKILKDKAVWVFLAVVYVVLFSFFDFRNIDWTTQVIRIVMGISISVELT